MLVLGNKTCERGNRILFSSISLWLLLLLFVGVSSFLFLPSQRFRLCVTSSEPTRLQSQCVYCNNMMFSQTLFVCTGATFLPINITIDQGICMVSTCRRQIPLQRPIFFGKRSIDFQPPDSALVKADSSEFHEAIEPPPTDSKIDTYEIFVEDPTSSAESSQMDEEDGR